MNIKVDVNIKTDELQWAPAGWCILSGIFPAFRRKFFDAHCDSVPGRFINSNCNSAATLRSEDKPDELFKTILKITQSLSI